VVALRRDIGVAAARLVVQAIVEAIKACDVGVDHWLLVSWSAEVIAEPSAGCESRAVSQDQSSVLSNNGI